jgi:hypothetical protein
MVGTKPLVCRGFEESDIFIQARAELMATLGLSLREIDDRLEAVEWALVRDVDEVAEQVPGLNLWVALIPRGLPPLRVYFKPHTSEEAKCVWMWIEERLA